MKRNWTCFAVVMFLVASASVQGQFEYTVNANNTITITSYTGPPWDVIIPANINGLTVSSIGDSAFAGSSVSGVTIPDSVNSIGEEAFYFCRSLASVTLGNGVTNMGIEAFYYCTSLSSLTISNGVTGIGDEAFMYCTSLASVTIPGSVNSIGDDAFSECTNLTNVIIDNGVTSIGQYAFEQCNLTSVTIPGSVTKIEDYAFYACNSLTSVFFTGDTPSVDSTVFAQDFSNPVIYYLPGTTGWSSPFASRQALLWNPLIQTSGTTFGVQSNQFGFNITGTDYIPIVVEACTNLANSGWLPLQTNTLTNGSYYFSDPQWTNYPERFYRISSP
jgi:BspA type Leucine rich repeat region (6 copies)